MRRALAIVAAVLVANGGAPSAAQISGSAPVIFVHGMGASASRVGTAEFADLLKGIASRYPTARDVCQEEAQPNRPWNGSPCVFRFVEDAAESDGGPNDSQSAVRDNANKLASEIDEVSAKAGRRVTLVGYSMGGAIIRTYLATHREDAGERVASVVLVDAVASGSWGYAFAGAVPRKAEGKLSDRLDELLRSLAASTAAVDFNRPATRDLSPRSDLFRAIAPMELPRNLDYYTFWGDIRVAIERKLLHYDLPDFALPSLGDLGLLPGDPDPKVLPELGGQRFSPPTDEDHVALDVPHETHITLDGSVVSDLISRCGHKPDPGTDTDCSALVSKHFSIPNTHTALVSSMGKVMIDSDELGGRMTLLEAVLDAIGRGA